MMTFEQLRELAVTNSGVHYDAVVAFLNRAEDIYNTPPEAEWDETMADVPSLPQDLLDALGAPDAALAPTDPLGGVVEPVDAPVEPILDDMIPVPVDPPLEPVETDDPADASPAENTV
jgi:hypothetical protein